MKLARRIFVPVAVVAAATATTRSSGEPERETRTGGKGHRSMRSKAEAVSDFFDWNNFDDEEKLLLVRTAYGIIEAAESIEWDEARRDYVSASSDRSASASSSSARSKEGGAVPEREEWDDPNDAEDDAIDGVVTPRRRLVPSPRKRQRKRRPPPNESTGKSGKSKGKSKYSKSESKGTPPSPPAPINGRTSPPTSPPTPPLPPPEPIDHESLPPPNANALTYSYNNYLGLPPHEQFNAHLGKKLFSLTVDDFQPGWPDMNGISKFKEFEGLSVTGSCDTSATTSSVSYSTSTSTLTAQSSGTSHGISIIDTTVSVKYKGFGAKRHFKAGGGWGNSKMSRDAFAQRDSGSSFTFSSSMSRQLYSAKIGYDALVSWTDEFKAACQGLGDTPSELQVLEFFRKNGSHGIKAAVMGQKCTASAFMESGYSMSSYSKFRRKTQSSSINLIFYKKKSSSTKTSLEEGLSENAFSTSITDVECIGELADPSSCGIDGTGRDNPAILFATFEPIWTMNIDGQLSNGAKAVMQHVDDNVTEAALRCSDKWCNSQGICAPNITMWETEWEEPADSSFYELFYDKDRCFCFDDRIGFRCDLGRELALAKAQRHPPQEDRYVNDFTEAVSFGRLDDANGDNVPICGVESFHRENIDGSWDSQKYSTIRVEDRRWAYETCRLDEDAARTIGRPQSSTTLGPSALRKDFVHDCPDNGVVTKIESEYATEQDAKNNTIYHYDRNHTTHCTNFTDVETVHCKTEPGNVANKVMKFTCAEGMVLTGIKAWYNSYHYDRQFWFRCCALKYKD